MGYLKDYHAKSVGTVGLGNAVGTWLQDVLTISSKTNSGVNVNEIKALQQSTIYSCVKIISENIASLPCHVYKKLDNGGKEIALTHSLESVVSQVSNVEMTAFRFWEFLISSAVLFGNGFAEIERDGRGNVVGLWPLLPDRTYLQRSLQDYKLYVVTTIPQTNEQLILPYDKVLHVTGLTNDGRVGYSPIKLMRELVGLSFSFEENSAKYFSNGARPGGVLETEAELTDDARKRLKAAWSDEHQGLSNAHRTAILEYGLKYKPIGLTAQESQFLESRVYTKRELASMFRIPLHMLNDMERSTNNNIEHQSIEFLTYTIRPWINRIKQECVMKLLTSSERQTLFVDWDVNDLLKGDLKTKYDTLHSARQDGVISTNEFRHEIGLNPIPDGDTYFINSTMVEVGANDAGGGGDDGNGNDPQTI